MVQIPLGLTEGFCEDQIFGDFAQFRIGEAYDLLLFRSIIQTKVGGATECSGQKQLAGVSSFAQRLIR